MTRKYADYYIRRLHKKACELAMRYVADEVQKIFAGNPQAVRFTFRGEPLGLFDEDAFAYGFYDADGEMLDDRTELGDFICEHRDYLNLHFTIERT